MNKIKEHIDKKISFLEEMIGKIERRYNKGCVKIQWVEEELYFQKSLLNEYQELKKLIEEEN